MAIKHEGGGISGWLLAQKIEEIGGPEAGEGRRRCELKGLRHLARQAGLDPANLNRVLKGRGKPSRMMMTKLQSFLAEEP